MSRGKKRQEKKTTMEERRKWQWEREERNEDEERRQKEGILIEGTDKGWKPSFTEWWGCTHITRHLPRIHSVRWVPSIPFISTTPSSGLSGKKKPGETLSHRQSHMWTHAETQTHTQIHTLTDNWEKDTLRPGSLFFFFLHTHTGKKKKKQSFPHVKFPSDAHTETHTGRKKKLQPVTTKWSAVPMCPPWSQKPLSATTFDFSVGKVVPQQCVTVLQEQNAGVYACVCVCVKRNQHSGKYAHSLSGGEVDETIDTSLVCMLSTRLQPAAYLALSNEWHHSPETTSRARS